VQAMNDGTFANKGATMSTHTPQVKLDEARTEQNIAYIRQMLGELRGVAHSENADMLCYLIEMAYLEAGDVLAGARPLCAVKSSN